MPGWQAIFETLGRHGIDVDERSTPRAVGGGDISAAWRIAAESGPIFLKTGNAAAFDMLDSQADGLRELEQAAAVRVPKVLASGLAGKDSFLALEWLSFQRPGAETARMLGTRLAAQHRVCRERFGWHRDNTIGNTPQVNTCDDNWVRFFRDWRLCFQLELAARNGYTGELQDEGRRLAERIERFFDNYDPEPSLLHGDLWGGNWAEINDEPVIFDPAVYFGDRESDIAMTKLFGGFASEFYQAYEGAWPLAGGHEKRLLLYQLYHMLNHLNLFGGSYLGRALALIRELNSE